MLVISPGIRFCDRSKRYNTRKAKDGNEAILLDFPSSYSCRSRRKNKNIGIEIEIERASQSAIGTDSACRSRCGPAARLRGAIPRRRPRAADLRRPQMELRFVGVATATEAECPRVIALSQLPVTLGRKAASGVIVVTGPAHVAKGKLLSRKHTTIDSGDGGAILVTDLGSVNGTYVGFDGDQANDAKLPGDTHPLSVV
jgi:hypothetical protein